MHLLATIPGTIADGMAAVDLAQTPGEIVVLSSADTELALLAAAQRWRRAEDPMTPRLRLASILRLGHNFSVDLYMETVAAARLVVARILGGSALLAVRRRAAGRNLPRARDSAGALARRRQSRPRIDRAVDRRARFCKAAVALPGRGRASKCPELLALFRNPDRSRQAVGRACAAVARRALLAGSVPRQPSPIS